MSRAQAFFDSFGNRPEERLAYEERSFERDRVAFVLKSMGIGSRRTNAIREKGKQVSGKADLYFDVFNDAFPGFPFVLGSSTLRNVVLPYTTRTHKVKTTPMDYRVHQDYHSLEPMRYKNFPHVPFVIAYFQLIERVEAQAQGRPIGLVFPRRGIMQGLIIHDDSSQKYWTEGFAQVYKYEAEGQSCQLFVQRFSDVIKAAADDPMVKGD